ncbi:MAG: di-heme oxidoredictase family protein [Myxococcota bacterium]|nr:di-heme oxidoredictase family protein [Myxococcota bacterium]
MIRCDAGIVAHARARWPGLRCAVSITLAAGWLAAPALAQDTGIPDPRPRSGLGPQEFADWRAGLQLFKQAWNQSTPGHNESRCSECHHRPTVGGHGNLYNSNILWGFTFDRASREAGIDRWPPSMDDGPDGPQAHLFQFRGYSEAIPSWANAMSRRVAPTLYGLGSIWRIPPHQILSRADPEDADGDGISGRALGRFGSQGQWERIGDVLRSALEHEVGVAPSDIRSEDLSLLFAFLRGLPDPIEWNRDDPDIARGREIFAEIGCTDCHTPSYLLGDGRVIRPYSDFLVHDMGPCLDDGISVGEAESYEWRTPPLWGVHEKGVVLLHDGRGARLLQQIQFHCGEGAAARAAFNRLDEFSQFQLRSFLNSLRIDP